MWFQNDYVYRRNIELTSPVSVSAGHPVSVVLPQVLEDNGKVREDYEDIEVVFETDDATPQVILLDRDVESTEDGIKVTFNLHEDIDADTDVGNYYVYHGNLALTNKPSRPTDSFAEWPITILSDTGEVSYTRPGEHWVDGKSNTLNARATFLFYGRKIRVISDLKPVGAIMEVQVDNGDWTSVNLFSRVLEEDQPVFSTEDLDPELRHEIRIRVSGEVDPSSLGDEVNIKSIEYEKSVITTDLGEELRSLAWSSFVGGV